MEQMEQIENAQRGNRKSSSHQKSRSWFFTKDNADIFTRAQFTKYFQAHEEIIDWVFQLERGEDTGMLHLQGVCRYANPRSSWPSGVDAHWERCRNWKAAVKYCTKLPSRVKGPWTNMKGLKYRKTIEDVVANHGPNNYQSLMMKEIEEPTNDRKILWFWDDGNTGKTCLLKHYLLKSKANIVCGGRTKDAIMLVRNLIEEEIDPEIIFFNLARSREHYVSYEAIEMIKDGICVNTKYECVSLIFNSPKVVIFANYRPDTTQLTEDRWEIIKVDREGA